MNTTCYIVDDEPHAIELLTLHIRQTPGLVLTGSETDPEKALSLFQNSPLPDITFLDIDMPDLNGLEMADRVGQHTHIIFTTSFRDYAVDAYERQAVDYLLKPIDYLRFRKAVDAALSRTLPGTPRTQRIPDFLLLKAGPGSSHVRIDLSELIYITGALNYLELHGKERRYIVYLTFAELLERLPSADFTRIHKSFVINHRYLKEVRYEKVIMEGNIELPIGRVYRSALANSLSAHFLGDGKNVPHSR